MDDETKRARERLDELSRSARSQAAEREVLAGLESKWEGVQVHAARALATWGGREFIPALCKWLTVAMARSRVSSLVGVALDFLLACCDTTDGEWLLDLYFDQASSKSAYRLRPALDFASLEQLRSRAAVEAQSKDPNRRDAARVASRRLAQREREMI